MISTDHCCRQYTVYRSVVLPYTVTHTHHYRTRSRSNSNNRSGPISARTCVCCCLCGLAVGGFGCGKRFGCCGYGFGGKDGMLQAPGCSAIPALLAGTAHAFSLANLVVSCRRLEPCTASPCMLACTGAGGPIIFLITPCQGSSKLDSVLGRQQLPEACTGAGRSPQPPLGSTSPCMAASSSLRLVQVRAYHLNHFLRARPRAWPPATPSGSLSALQTQCPAAAGCSAMHATAAQTHSPPVLHV